MEADDIDVQTAESQEEELQSNEISQISAVLRRLGALEKTINYLQQDQVLLLGSVTKFANRTERRQNDNFEKIRSNHELLQEVIGQLQDFAYHNEAMQSTQVAVITQLQSEITTLKFSSTKGPNTDVPPKTPVPTGTIETPGAEWDVFGPMPVNTPVFSNNELEVRVTKCHKQRETPVYSGEASEDIKVYALNMIRWYAAYGLYFQRDQVDLRVGELMMNHTKGKAKSWCSRNIKESNDGVT
ncbi:hypothetical protein PHMEG_0009587 [Phytophthora megakarya]|uniref:Uncharacterized protein n=1 Tax=Phytophthora megakarya TaxID=4795 RepID=A0A225WFU6_9STRA|nr:hypothetical protein PHMEG_0009587 [Phytophthora megakarya]